MELINIDKRIVVQIFRNEDLEEFSAICERSHEENYYALRSVWNKGIEVWLIYKIGFWRNVNIGFLSTIDCSSLRGNEKIIRECFNIPGKFSGIFINDMRMGTKYRKKGIGTKIVTALLKNDRTYMLEPVEDGKTFWKKFGFVDGDTFAVREAQ